MEPGEAFDGATEPEATSRFASLMPAARQVVGRVRLLAILAVLSALLIWVLSFSAWMAGPAARQASALFALALLLLPPAGTGLAVLALNEFLSLPERIREIPRGIKEAAGSRQAGLRGAGPRGRWTAATVVLWRIGSVLRSSRAGWLRAAGLIRLARLASLPAVMFMVTAFLMCFPLIFAAGVTVVIRLLAALGQA